MGSPSQHPSHSGTPSLLLGGSLRLPGPSGEGAPSSHPTGHRMPPGPKAQSPRKPAPRGLAAGNTGSLSPWKPQAGLTQVCDPGAEARPLHFCQRPAAPSDPHSPPRGRWGLPRPHLPSLPRLQTLCGFHCVCPAPHPRHPAGSPLLLPEDLLEASQVTLEGRRDLLLGPTLPQARRQVLGK